MVDLLTLFLAANIINLFFNRKQINLSCGIWGFNGREGKKVNMTKILILGLYNRTRGTDSFGYYYNGNIVKGVDKEADFKDFIAIKKIISGDLPHETLMCHARKSTYGAHSAENAHPHEVGNYVQTHNGTIKDIWTLCTNHKIIHTNIHVDSIGLAHIIEQDGFSVLNDYGGYAALTMVFKDDPLSFYLYHGASKETKDGDLYEERPLWYLKTTEGIYYSSMKEPLDLINIGKNKPEVLPHNNVFKLQNGEIINSVYKVKRDENNVSKIVTSTYYNKNEFTRETGYNNYTQYNAHVGKQTTMGFLKIENQNQRSAILKETDPPEALESDIYYRYGRYHRLTYEEKDNKMGPYEILLHGKYNISRKGEIFEDDSEEIRKSDSKVETYYFIRGAMMQNEHSYTKCLSEYESKNYHQYNMSQWLSSYSKHPITSYSDEAKSCDNTVRNVWFEKRERCKGVFKPKFTKREYEIKDGLLNKITGPTGSKIALNPTDVIDYSRKIWIDVVTEENTNEVNEELPTTVNDYEEIFLEIEKWADKIIKIEEVTLIPECFLIFLELYFEESSGKGRLSEAELFNLGVIGLQGMIDYKKTLLELFKDNFEDPDYLNVETVASILIEYPIQDLTDCINRYKLVEFAEYVDTKKTDGFTEEEIIENTTKDVEEEVLNAKKTQEEEDKQTLIELEKEEAKRKFKAVEDQLKMLNTMADELQELDTCEESQNVARSIYVTIDKISETIEQNKK